MTRGFHGHGARRAILLLSWAARPDVRTRGVLSRLARENLTIGHLSRSLGASVTNRRSTRSPFGRSYFCAVPPLSLASNQTLTALFFAFEH